MFEVEIMYYILSEPFFTASPWYRIIYNSLTDELSRKKLQFIHSGSIIQPTFQQEKSYAFLIGTNAEWLNKNIEDCLNSDIHPIILSTQQNSQLNGIYSSVTSNLESSFEIVMKYLQSISKSRTALFGVNKLSLTNMTLFEKFKCYNCYTSDSIYYNDGSVSNCADMFINDIDKYDSVISVNDFSSVFLLKKLSETKKDIFVISFGGTNLARKYYPWLATVSMGYENFGKAAVSLSEALKNNSAVDYMTYTVKCNFENINPSANFNVLSEDSRISGNAYDKKFYADSEMNDMIRLENMLLNCDETDYKILNLLIRNYSYEYIAEKLFCALNTVKYRVKKMKENCNCSSKNEMLAIFGNYCEI